MMMKRRKVGAGNFSFKNSHIQMPANIRMNRTGYLLWPVGVGMLTGWGGLCDLWFTVTDARLGLT
jgi:hypothetical protein